MRHIADRWADEDRQQTARDTLLNFTSRYRYKNFEAFLSIENRARSSKASRSASD